MFWTCKLKVFITYQIHYIHMYITYLSDLVHMVNGEERRKTTPLGY